MENETKIEPYNQTRAKQVIDTMFESKIFAEHITRDDMQGFEDLIAFEFQTSANSSHRIAKFAAEWNVKYPKNKL